MDRRLFLAGLAAASLPLPARASADPGTPAAPDLFAAFDGLRGFTEGVGRGTMQVIYAPWCSVTPRLFADTRAFLGRIRIKWVPFSGGQPEGKLSTDNLLRSNSVSEVRNSFVHVRPLSAIPPTPLADAQDAALDRALSFYYRDVGGSFMTPTVIYRTVDGRVRVVKGAPAPRHIELIARVAA